MVTPAFADSEIKGKTYDYHYTLNRQFLVCLQQTFAYIVVKMKSLEICLFFFGFIPQSSKLLAVTFSLTAVLQAEILDQLNHI